MNTINFNQEICSQRSCLESFALKFTNDVDDANDLVQDTLIKAIRYVDLYQQGTNLRAWLYTIMKNTFINSYRSGARRKVVISTVEDVSVFQTQKNSAKNLGENKFIMEDINKALANLPSVYAVPFLRYFEGYKYHEIAKELDIPIGTVKTRIHMARQALKNQLKMYSSSNYIS